MSAHPAHPSCSLLAVELCWLGALLAGLAACTPEFEDVWLVKDLRILGLQAEPPEVLVSTPSATVPPVQVRALAVNPKAGAGAVVAWQLWACTAEETMCEAAAARQPMAEGRTPLDAIQAEVLPSRPLLEAALREDIGKGFGGVPLMVELQVEGGGFADRALKRLVYGLPIPPQKTPNANPALKRLLADGKEIMGGKLEVVAGQTVKLLPEPAPAAREKYWVATFTGGSRELEEYLSYAFFTTGGKLSDATTGGKPSPFVERKKVDDPSSDWTAPEEPGKVLLWVVVRDDRGGVSWAEVEATVR